jgi:hypothetical protein
MSQATAATAKARRKRPTYREGARFRIGLVKGEEKLSFSISPSDTGYTLRGRNRRPGDKVRMAVEHFSEAATGDSFAAAKKRAQELAEQATQKGWKEHQRGRTIEDLF